VAQCTNRFDITACPPLDVDVTSSRCGLEKRVTKCSHSEGHNLQARLRGKHHPCVQTAHFPTSGIVRLCSQHAELCPLLARSTAFDLLIAQHSKSGNHEATLAQMAQDGRNCKPVIRCSACPSKIVKQGVYKEFRCHNVSLQTLCSPLSCFTFFLDKKSLQKGS